MLSPIDAPQIAGHPLCVMADIDATGDQGVIISQGASGSGFSLHLKDGKPAFAIRIKNQLTAVVGEKPLGKGRHHLRAELKKDGSVTLSVDVSEVASGKAPGLIADQPMRGLTVGSSYFAVGDYPAKSVFPGRVENAYVQTF